MLKYELINGHYIVTIADKKYVIDTGSPWSFNFTNRPSRITINGIKYVLWANKLDPTQTADTLAFVGSSFDGFIGMDIIAKTSLTIYKNGEIDFSARDVDCKGIPFYNVLNYIAIDTNLGRFLVDTGAKYGYGIKPLFRGMTAFDYVKDYNPGLGKLESYLYSFDIKLSNGNTYQINIGDNAKVEKYVLMPLSSDVIGGIETFFEEVCVIDMNKGLLFLK